jgi:hypothetical protein
VGSSAWCSCEQNRVNIALADTPAMRAGHLLVLVCVVLYCAVLSCVVCRPVPWRRRQSTTKEAGVSEEELRS